MSSNSNCKYIAKAHSWFDEGTEAILIDDYRVDGWPCGLFKGTRQGKPDEEICNFEEFDG